MRSPSEHEEKDRLKKERLRKLESPIPFVILLRNWVFGKKRPDIYTRLTFLANLIIWMLFLIWSGFSYFALLSKEWIWEQKGLAITWIIERRGSQLGFEEGVFMNRLEFANLAAIICWALFFVGLVFLYRKKRIFVYFTLIPLLAYVALNCIYLSFPYFLEDITLFDKVLLLISLLSLTISAFLIRGERDGSSSNFFGVSPDEDTQETM